MSWDYKEGASAREISHGNIEMFFDLIGMGVEKFCPTGAEIIEVVPFFAKGQKGDKFRIYVIVAPTGASGDSVAMIEMFGNVKYLKLKLEDYNNNVADAMKYDKCHSYLSKHDAQEKIGHAYGWFKKERRGDTPVYMQTLSNTLNELLDGHVSSEVKGSVPIIEAPTVTADSLIDSYPANDAPIVDEAGDEKSWHEDW